MGAALTYARRYALFALVGIAGEDDLDAPDMPSLKPTAPPPQPELTSGTSAPLTSHPRNHNGRSSVSQPKPLAAEKSRVLREQLLQDVAGLNSSEQAGIWAHKVMPLKNTLALADAQMVEVAFASRMTALGEGDTDQNEVVPTSAEANSGDQPKEPSGSLRSDRPHLNFGTIDKSVLALPEPRRLRDKAHLKFVATHPCLICGRAPADAHHLRFAQPRALGRKASDEFTVPLCRGHHREVHRHGDEAQWWRQADVNAVEIAASLWAQTHPLRDG